MTRRVAAGDAASLAYDVVGTGTPLLAFHGAYSARIEMRRILEPVLEGRPIRRIYVDLPGQGESRPSSGLRTPDDVLDLVDLLLAAEAPTGPVLLAGHSFGAFFARAVAARHPSRVAGLALLDPVMAGEWDLPPTTVVRDDRVSAELAPDERAGYEGYFVVRTADTLQRFRDAVAPSTGAVDDETLDRAIATGPFAIDPDSVAREAPVLVAGGREDAFVGWRRQYDELVDRYPRATVVAVSGAGHALPHERPDLVAALIDDWLSQALSTP